MKNLTMFIVLLASFAFPGYCMAQSANSDSLAAVSAASSEVRWQPKVEHSRVILTVSAPGGRVYRREFEAGASPSFKLKDEDGMALPDGSYTYELVFTPVLSDGVKEALAAARQEGRSDDLEREFKKANILPSQSLVQSGSFFVQKGSILVRGSADEPKIPGSVEVPLTVKKASKQAAGGGRVNPQDVVEADDLIVQGSACVGLDCVNNESFGFDTMRLKENNTRIKFDDTSTSAGFPNNDWQLTANDSASGGANKFSIDDVTNSKTPFTLTAGAPTNSLFVDSSGRLGLGTSTPVLDIHKVKGDTPAIRLEQNATSGFTAQTWDVAGNEANFFVRDVTGGSRLPLRIRPGAPTSSIDIAASGNVGVGTASPNSNLHILGSSDATTLLRVQNSTVAVNTQAGVAVQSDTAGADYKAHASARTISRWGVTLGGWVEFLGTAGNGLAIGTQGPFPLILGTNSADTIHITSSGNVGINTSTPNAAAALDVNGKIYQRGVLLHADYVFEPSNSVESIEEHSQFMWNNRHLPAVEAKSVDSEGREVVEIGARSRQMLEELEKAHIYIDQLNNRLSQRDAEVATLASTVSAQEKALTELKAAVARLEKPKAKRAAVSSKRR